MTDLIIYQNSELYYYKEGVGDKAILLFHGFGQDHHAFDDWWAEMLLAEYTIYRFDLFFHGSSKWENPNAIKKEDWKKILQLFFTRENVTTFEVVGFSIGAKFCLTALELFPERVKKIILVAPDGIVVNFWYRYAMGTSTMRSLFRGILLNRKNLNTILYFFKTFHLTSKELLRFVESSTNSEEKRKRVYYSWVYFRHLKVDLKKLTQLLNSIPTSFVLGKYDTVIPLEQLEKFIMTISNRQLYIIEAKHNDVLTKAIALFKNKKGTD